MPLFSVIIPVHNRPEQVRRAIDSVLGQGFRDFELIVVDDGSDDDTPRVLDEYRARARIVRIGHAGVSAARNAGIRASDAPWIAFLDSDDEWLPAKLGRQAEFIAARPGVALHQTGDTWIRLGRRVNPGRRHMKREGRIFIESLERCLVSPSAAVLSRRLLDAHGDFDEDLPACEDYDLWLRIASEERIGLVPERLVVRHAGHADQLSARYWGMDRFRVYAIVKLLREREGRMRDEYRAAAIRVALAKSRILLAGASKRGNRPLCEKLESLVARIESGSFGDRPSFLLEG